MFYISSLARCSLSPTVRISGPYMTDLSTPLRGIADGLGS